MRFSIIGYFCGAKISRDFRSKIASNLHAKILRRGAAEIQSPLNLNRLEFPYVAEQNSMRHLFPKPRQAKCADIVRGFFVAATKIELIGTPIKFRSRLIGSAWEGKDGSIFVRFRLLGFQIKLLLHQEPL